jgi:hypothetical protein
MELRLYFGGVGDYFLVFWGEEWESHPGWLALVGG